MSSAPDAGILFPDSAANCKEISFAWISTQIPYLSLFSEFHVKPKIAFSHLYFGAFCNLVFLSSYPLIFFDYSRFSPVWQPSSRTTFPCLLKPYQFQNHMKVHGFYTFSDAWGFLSRRIPLLSHKFPLFFPSVYFIVCQKLLPTSFSYVTFPEDTRDVLLCTLPLLWTSVSLLWCWWALEPTSSGLIWRLFSSLSSGLRLFFHIKEKSPHLSQCSPCPGSQAFLGIFLHVNVVTTMSLFIRCPFASYLHGQMWSLHVCGMRL